MQTIEKLRLTNTLSQRIYEAETAANGPSSPVLPTEFHFSKELSEMYDAEVWLISEANQNTGAYKIRGAYNFLRQLGSSQENGEIVTASAGNHAQGVACCASRMAIKNTIFMPINTPDRKIEGVKTLGGEFTEVVLAGGNFDQSYRVSRQYEEKSDATFIHPFDDLAVIAGQGTLGLEILSGCPDTDVIVCPVGGGGLISGVGTIAKNVDSRIEIVGVEPSGAASMEYAFVNEKVLPLPKAIDTFVDGAAVQTCGMLTFKVAREVVDELVDVSNMQIRRATTLLWEGLEQPIKAELAGALAVAGLEKIRQKIKHKKVAALVSGGNLSEARYRNQVRLE